MGDESDLTDQLLAAADLLEAVGADRSILDALSPEDRIRFLNAAANAFEPDVEARRRQTKARRRQEKDARCSATRTCSPRPGSAGSATSRCS